MLAALIAPLLIATEPMPGLEAAKSTGIIAANAPEGQTLRLSPSEPPAIAQLAVPSTSLPLPADRPAPLPETPPDIDQLPDPSDLLRSIPTSPSSDATHSSTETDEEVVTVRRFNVVGSTVFDQTLLDDTLESFRNRPLTFDELLEARDAITNLYVDQGYITSGAFIPGDQVIDNGTVTIQVLEGKLADIQVEGTTRLKPAYIRSRLGLAAAPPINISDVLETLQLLQLSPIIENISAELVTNPSPGENTLIVRVEEAQTFAVDVQLSNSESPALETFQQKIEVTEENFSGYGDTLSVTYQHAGDSHVFETDYTLPISPHNTSLDLSYTHTSSEILESPLSLISPQFEADTWSIGISQPILETPADKVTLGLHLEQRTSRSFIQPPGLPKTPFGFPGSGATEDGLTRLSVLQFSQEWQHRTANQLIFVDSQFNFGTNWLGATNNPEPDEPGTEFFSWQAQALWLQRLNPDWLLIGRVAGQLAARPLVSSELFGLGGANNVRGYRKDNILSDSGVLASVELQTPIVRWPDQETTLSLAPFIDYGFGWNQDNQPLANQHLASIGTGLIFQIDNNFSARLDYAIPLINDDNSGDTLQESGFLFVIDAHFF